MRAVLLSLDYTRFYPLYGKPFSTPFLQSVLQVQILAQLQISGIISLHLSFFIWVSGLTLAPCRAVLTIRELILEMSLAWVLAHSENSCVCDLF